MLLLPIRANIPIHVMMATVLIRWMLVMSMLLLLVLGIVVVVEVIEGRRRRRIFCEAGLLLVGVVVSCGEVLLGGDWGELGGVVVGRC